MRLRAAAGLLATLGGFGVGCSDDTYVATNQSLGGSGGGAGSGTGAVAGSAGAGGAAGADGAAGSAGHAPDGGECTPGEKQTVGTCQRCGASRRTCKPDGTWGDPVCEDQKECNPGDKTAAGCDDPCAEKTCGSSCTFGACGKKTGAQCLYESGTNWQCCGNQKWQYCSSSCQWFPCQTCSSGSACYTKC